MHTVRFIEPEVIDALQKRKLRDELIFAQLRAKSSEFRAVIINLSLHIQRANLALDATFLNEPERALLAVKVKDFQKIVKIANCKRQMFLNLCDFEQEVYKLHDDELVELTNTREQRLAKIHTYLQLVEPYELNDELNEMIKNIVDSAEEEEKTAPPRPKPEQTTYLEQKLCINYPALSSDIIVKELELEDARKKITEIDTKIQELQETMVAFTIVTRSEIIDPSSIPQTGDEDYEAYDTSALD